MREMWERRVGEAGRGSVKRGPGSQDAVDGEERRARSDAVLRPGSGGGHGSGGARLELLLGRVPVIVGHVVHTGHWVRVLLAFGRRLKFLSLCLADDLLGLLSSCGSFLRIVLADRSFTLCRQR